MRKFALILIKVILIKSTLSRKFILIRHQLYIKLYIQIDFESRSGHKQELTSTRKNDKSHSILPEPDVCGQINFPEDFRDDKTELGEFPWTVQIAYLHKDIFVNRFDCNGVLINANHVLTSGSCIEPVIGMKYIAKP